MNVGVPGGVNGDNMTSFLIIIGSLVALGVIMMCLFKRRKWF